MNKIEALREELLKRCGTIYGTTDIDCPACEERQPCIHNETGSLSKNIEQLLEDSELLFTENTLLRKQLKLVCEELGVPGPGTPVPVENAYIAAKWAVKPRLDHMERIRRMDSLGEAIYADLGLTGKDEPSD